jgi:lipopolysaccharide biosynthesis glycosyltransferase
MNGKILNVLYQSDDNYAMVSGISIVSLLENNKHLKEINVYYLDHDIKVDSVSKLEEIVNKYQNAKIIFIDARGYQKIFKKLGVKPWHGVYITWLKMLAFGDLSLNTDRVLFINGHTIINGSLDELIDLDFEDNVMALSYDALVNDHKKTIGLKENDGYYNCGIMLINHAKWIKDDLDDVVKKSLSKKSDYVIADQDLCNVLFKNRIKTVNSTYNFSSAYYAYNLKRFLKINDLRPEYFYSYEELMENYYSPKIIHSLFGIKGKPWELNNDHPQRFLWSKYINMTPWKDSQRRVAKRTLNWLLYDVLPNAIFMRLYITAVRRKFSK